MFDTRDNERAAPPPSLEDLLRRFKLLSGGLETAHTPDQISRHYREMTSVLSSIRETFLADVLFERYKLRIEPGGSVEFVLPKGECFENLYRECNEYSLREWGRPAIADAVIAMCENETARFEIPREIVGVVPGSTMKTRSEQGNLVCSQGLLIPTLGNAAAAAALYYCRTGKDLFGGLSVRAGDVAIRLGPRGIELASADRNWQVSAQIACAGTPILGAKRRT